jgi:hypothetical protein
MLVFARVANRGSGYCDRQMVTCEKEDHSQNTESKDGRLPKVRKTRVVLWDESPDDEVQEDDENNKTAHER